MTVSRGNSALQLHGEGGYAGLVGILILVGRRQISKRKERSTQVDSWDLEVGFGWLAPVSCTCTSFGLLCSGLSESF